MPKQHLLIIWGKQMNNPLPELSGFSIQIIIIIFLLNQLLKAKSFTSHFILFILAMASRIIRLEWLTDHFWGASLEIAFFLFSLFFLYKDTLTKKIFTFCLLLFTMLLSDFLAYLTLNALYGHQLSDSTSLLLSNPVSILIINLIFLMVALLVLNIWELATNNLEQSQMTLFMFFPLSQIYLLIILLILAFQNNSLPLITTFVISVILCILADIGLIIAMKKLTQMSLLREKLGFLKKHLKNQLNYYQQMNTYQTNLNKCKHDFKNQLQTIYTLLDQQKLESARNFTNQLVCALDESIPTPFCQNPVINALLQNKFRVAQKNKINIKITNHLDNITEVDELHLCNILANLLDNAIEACQKITNPQIIPKIDLQCYRKGTFLIIKVINTKENKIITSPKRFFSDKKDRLQHGLGLTIVKDITQKYNGELHIEHNDHKFKAIAILSLKNL